MHEVARRDHHGSRAPSTTQAIRRRHSQHLVYGSDGLVSEHQYFSRSALGPRPGDLWRGSVSDGRMGVAFVTGLQGDDSEISEDSWRRRNIFAVHSGPEPTRHTVNVKLSPHDLEDTYLPAFRATVMEGRRIR